MHWELLISALFLSISEYHQGISVGGKINVCHYLKYAHVSQAKLISRLLSCSLPHVLLHAVLTKLLLEHAEKNTVGEITFNCSADFICKV